jgi:hypothetical protein
MYEERPYLCEEIKKCYLCNQYIEYKYVLIQRLHFHKKCLFKLLKKLI